MPVNADVTKRLGAENMKKFLAIYLGSNTSASAREWASLNEAARKEREKAGMKSWSGWATENHKAISDNGSPLGKTKRVDRGGISDVKNAMAAWTIVQAETHDAAAKLFINHAHFTLFPGDSVEIMECLPMPSM